MYKCTLRLIKTLKMELGSSKKPSSAVLFSQPYACTCMYRFFPVSCSESAEHTDRCLAWESLSLHWVQVQYVHMHLLCYTFIVHNSKPSWSPTCVHAYIHIHVNVCTKESHLTALVPGPTCIANVHLRVTAAHSPAGQPGALYSLCNLYAPISIDMHCPPHPPQPAYMYMYM